MTETLSREEEIRIAIDNVCFSIRYLIGVLAELEQLGRTNTVKYKQIEKNVNVLKHNKKRLEEELERIETETFEQGFDFL